MTNSLARRTKEMMSGHRHDVLNDAFGDFNVRKLHATREYLSGFRVVLKLTWTCSSRRD